MKYAGYYGLTQWCSTIKAGEGTLVVHFDEQKSKNKFETDILGEKRDIFILLIVAFFHHYLVLLLVC